jgi:hypothetical protein
MPQMLSEAIMALEQNNDLKCHKTIWEDMRNNWTWTIGMKGDGAVSWQNNRTHVNDSTWKILAQTE